MGRKITKKKQGKPFLGFALMQAEAETTRLRVINVDLLEALQFVIDFKITDSNGWEVEEDSLHESRKIARAAIARATGEQAKE